MMSGVFELLADTRDQVDTVVAAINAQQVFWLANAALQTALIGNPATIEIGKQVGRASGNSELPH